LSVRNITFNQADSATTTNPPSDGGSGQNVSSGSTWGVSSNRCYLVNPSGSTNYAIWWDAGVSDQGVQVTIPVMAGDLRLLFRVQDDDNHLLFLLTTSSMALYEKVAGTYSPVSGGSVGTGVASGDTLRVEAVGDQILLKQNGTTVIGPVTYSAHFEDKTAAGFGNFNTPSARFDNFVVDDLAPAPPDYTSIANGDWDTAGTWQNGLIPDATHQGTVKHAVTVSANKTLPGFVMSGNLVALTLNDSKTLTLTANVDHQKGTFHAGAGSVVTFDTAAAGGNLKWIGGVGSYLELVGTANAGDDANLPCATTGGNHCVVQKTGPNRAWFDVTGEGTASPDGCLGCDVQYCDLVGLANSSGLAMGTTNTGGLHQRLIQCRPTKCGTFWTRRNSSQWDSQFNKDYRMDNVRFGDPLGGADASDANSQNAYLFCNGTTGSGVLRVFRCSFDKRVAQVGGHLAAVDGNYFDDCLAALSPEGTFGSAGARNVLRQDFNTALALGVSFTYYLADHRAPNTVGNPHYISSGEFTYEGIVWEWRGPLTIDYGDCLFGNLANATIKNCLILPSAANEASGYPEASGDLLNPGSDYPTVPPGADWTVHVLHCTIVGNDATLIFTEAARPAGVVAEARSNVIAAPTAGANYVWDGLGGQNTDIITPANLTHNWIHNYSVDTDRVSGVPRHGFVDHHLTSDPAGNFESTGTGYAAGPDFVDPTRNAAMFAVHKGWASGGDTLDQKYDAWRSHLAADPRYGEECRLWVLAGFAPRNPALRAAHDNVAPTNGWIGAVAGQVGGVGLVGSGLVSNNTLVNHGGLVA
jgi:hypothetical protein